MMLTMRSVWWLSVVVSIFSGMTASADPLNGSFELGTSTSQSYDARSIFIHPAGLGYQTELNGTELSSSFTHSINRDAPDDFALGLGLGYLGFGAERFAGFANPLSRYQFGLGVPLWTNTFIGMRYGLYRFDNGPGFESFDAGLQWRASRFFSLSFLTNRINQPVVTGSGISPIQFVSGTTIRPLPILELTVDVDTKSGTDAFKIYGYQAMLGVEAAPGVKLRAGYSDTYLFQFGVQLGLGHAAVYSSYQPGSALHRLNVGFQAGATPYRSTLAPPSVLKIEIDNSLAERASGGGIWGAGRPTLFALLKKLESVEKSRVDLVVIHLESFPLGMASAQEVYSALLKLRMSGKRIEVYLGNATTKEYLIASGASAIFLEPAGELRFLGFRTERYFIKGTLDKIGVQGEFLARGEYKSAPEMFTREDSSKESRDVAFSEMRNAQQALSAYLAQGRNISSEQWNRMCETALYGPEEALEAKLVDGLRAYSTYEQALERSSWVRESLEEKSEALSLPKRVAVVVADGSILNQKVKLLSVGGESQVTPDGMKRRLDRAVHDPRTKAIVLRVSSPGGEILASHEIATLVENARQKKPVIISMGDVAASGGYYISAPGDRVFADNLTLTGSIGVFVGKFSAQGLYKNLKVNKEILSSAPYAGLFTEHRPWSTAELRLMTRRLNQYYGSFVKYVSEKRSLTPEAAEAAAKGRVWLGGEAFSLKLVDEIGGYREAVAYAAKKAGLPNGNYDTWQVADPPGWLEYFGVDAGFASSEMSVDPLQHLLSHSAARELLWIESLARNPFLYLSEIEKLE